MFTASPASVKIYHEELGSGAGRATIGRVAPTAVDADTFQAAVAPHRRELLVHCYRMLGSVDDAHDVLQETMMRAWRAFARHDPGRASVRTWLYRIATNACLNALEARKRRPLPSDIGPAFDNPDAAFVPGFDVPWLQPIPDALLGTAPSDPAELAIERSRLRLALVATLQLLPARQRAVLLLREVLDVPAAEVAELLDTTTAAVNSALQRARATLASARTDLAGTPDPDEKQQAVVDAFVAAFEAADVAGLTRLLHREVVLEMPPMWNWYRGVAAYGAFMERVFRTRGTRWRSLSVAANLQPAVAAYRADADSVFMLHTLQVFTVDGGQIVRTTVFQDPHVFELFDLPVELRR
jgi:RNA polymerase sigma-70 factor (ECF subfamily)